MEATDKVADQGSRDGPVVLHQGTAGDQVRRQAEHPRRRGATPPRSATASTASSASTPQRSTRESSSSTSTLEFKNGKIVEARRRRATEAAQRASSTATRARATCGEFALGFNPYITRRRCSTRSSTRRSPGQPPLDARATPTTTASTATARRIHWDLVLHPAPGVGRRRDLVRRQARPQGRALRAEGAEGTQSEQAEVEARSALPQSRGRRGRGRMQAGGGEESPPPALIFRARGPVPGAYLRTGALE